MSLEELWPYVIIVVAVAVTVLFIAYSIVFGRRSKKEETERPQNFQVPEALEKWRYRARTSVSSEEVKTAGEELRMLGVEREILSDAIRRLYEAHAEGRITEVEREDLARSYKARMRRVKEAFEKNQSIVALHELEVMQEDLMNLFNERFDTLSTKIDSLRSQVGIETEEKLIPTQILPQIEGVLKEKTPSKRTPSRKPPRKPKQPKKATAEERIEKIRTEVEKVLDRLEQMEAEG